MAGKTTQAKGKANKAAGSIKKTVGKATKDRSLQAKGTVQKAKGAVLGTQLARWSARSVVSRATEEWQEALTGWPPAPPARSTIAERRRCRWGDCDAVGSVAASGRGWATPSGLCLADRRRGRETARVGRPFRLCQRHADEMTRLVFRLDYEDGRVVFKGDPGLSC